MQTVISGYRSGYKLAYVESGEKNGTTPIVFVHGNSNSKEVFEKQLRSDLSKKYRLIALDLPGHGESEFVPDAKENKSVYTLPFYAKCISEFIYALGIPSPIVVGHSLGGHIATLASTYIPFRGLMSFQAPPLETHEDLNKGFNPVPGLGSLFRDKIEEADFNALMKVLFPSGDVPEFVSKAFRNTDPLCRKNVAESLTPDYRINEVTNLNKLKNRVCIPFAEKDGLINGQYLRSIHLPYLWKNGIISFPKAGHYLQLEESAAFNALLDEFAQSLE